MQMVVDGNNSFHTGLLARLLGLPRWLPGAGAIKAGDLAAFLDGRDMADETPDDLRYSALHRMVEARQAHVGWIDDNGEDLELPLN